MREKMNGIKQHDNQDCGLACLATIFKFYGLTISLVKLRKGLYIRNGGTSLNDLVEISLKYNFDAQALKGNLEELKVECKENKIIYPFIAHVITEDNRLHFIVVKKIKGNKVRVFDPACGDKTYGEEEFSKIWTGYIINIVPNQNFKKKNYKKGEYYKFLNIMFQLKGYIIVTLILSFLLSFISVLVTVVYREVIDNVIVKNETSPNEYLVKIIMYIGILVLLQSLFSIIRGNMVLRLSIKMDTKLLRMYFEKLLKLQYDFFQDRESGELLSRFQDLSDIRMVLSQGGINLLFNLSMVFVGAFMLFHISITMFQFVVVLIILYMITILLHIKPFKANERKMKENYSNIVSHLKETIDGIEVIKTNNLQEKKKEQLDVLVSKLIQNNYSLGSLDICLSTITEFIESMFLVVVLFMGSTLVLKGDISLGELIMFEYLIYFFLNPIKSVILTLPELQNFIVSLDRLNDIFESEEESDLQRKYDGIISWNKIEINHIYFSYNNEMDVLSDVSTLVRNGESLALVGESGSGKSTFAKLLVAFNQLYRGNIFIDDINIDSIPLHTLRKNIIYVPQNTFLFNGSVKNNLFLGDVIENDIYDILLACGIGGMDDDIDLDFVLCENGSNLSGGQRQRIALARALITFPKVLILDEATCHIDKKREKQIMDFIKSTFCKKILIVITHDEKIAQECDKIIDFHKNYYLYGR